MFSLKTKQFFDRVFEETYRQLLSVDIGLPMSVYLSARLPVCLFERTDLIDLKH